MENPEQFEQGESLPPQSSSKRKYLLIGFVVVLVVLVFVGIYLYQQPQVDRQSLTESSLQSDKVEEGMSDEEIEAEALKTAQKDTVVTDDWLLYTSPNFGYSFKIPPEFQRRPGTNMDNPIEFRVTEEFSGPGHNVLARFDIDVFSMQLIEPLLTEEQKEFFTRLQTAAPGEEIVYEGIFITKIKDVNLDGCIASQWAGKSSGDFIYQTHCFGEIHSLSLTLEADKLENFEEYKKLYDVILSTFRFNELIDFILK